MIKTLMTRVVALLGGVLLTLQPAQDANAATRAIDNPSGATLLLPYFEADLSNPNGPQTILQLENTSATAVLANVTLWTDLGIPTQNFTLYFVGYDNLTLDLRLLFKNGTVPVTASAGQDPTNLISPRGPISQDINFASCSGTLPPAPLPAATLTGLRAAHTGQASGLFGNQCVASPRADSIARGYITIDAVNQCTTSNPTSPGYNAILTLQPVFSGSFVRLSRGPGADFSEFGGHLVAVESPFTADGTSGPNFTAGDRTFYGSYNALSAGDQREPLGSVWSARYVNGGALATQTSLVVWRDPGSTVMPFACGGALPAPFPLTVASGGVAAFDEQESVVIATASNQFPLATQRVPVSSLTSNTFGWLYLNLNRPAGPGATQSWVQVEQNVTGRFSSSFPAAVLESTASLQGCTAPCGLLLNN